MRAVRKCGMGERVPVISPYQKFWRFIPHNTTRYTGMYVVALSKTFKTFICRNGKVYTRMQHRNTLPRTAQHTQTECTWATVCNLAEIYARDAETSSTRIKHTQPNWELN